MMAAMIELSATASKTCRGGSCSTSTTPKIGSTVASSFPCSMPITTVALSALHLRGDQRQAGRRALWPGRRRRRRWLSSREVVKAIRRRWPRVDILIRGDSHYARHEAMTGASTTGSVMSRPPATRFCSARSPRLPRTRRSAGSMARARKSAARRVPLRRQELEARAPCDWPRRGLIAGQRQPLRHYQPRRHAALAYESVYCARGQAENLIKAHKLHLASDRTSCTSATANQFRLLIHTAAYWLLHTLRGLAPKTSFWRAAQSDTIRLALIKVAARVVEMVTRIEAAVPLLSSPDQLGPPRRSGHRAAALTHGATCPDPNPSLSPPSRPPALPAPPSPVSRNRHLLALMNDRASAVTVWQVRSVCACRADRVGARGRDAVGSICAQPNEPEITIVINDLAT